MVMWEIFAFGRAPYPRMGQKDVVDAIVKGFRMECPDTCPKVRGDESRVVVVFWG